MDPVLTNTFEKAEDSYSDALPLMEHGRYAGCINRCYYSLYYLTYSLLLYKKIHVKTHKGIIGKFSEAYIESGELPVHLSTILKIVFQKRIQADYDMDANIGAGEAVKLVADTRELPDTVKRILDK